ncbi:hypothetical protein PRZ48_000603 [Zasmidium cellare]|uniref:Acid phosphatase n=1 Tax=Zasmidium cellare TaxID=395010 RepID=A0ABR0EZI5_ZASCE|nr:hypothetical protein PRZ48_000603 [Zasmidium cellare]
MLELYQHLQRENVTFKGDLAFLNGWNFFAPHPNDQFDQLTATGPYAGTLEAFATGVKLRTRYEKLLEEALAQNKTSFWAGDSQRVIETAQIFATGFFGLDWEKTAKLHIVPEDLDTGGNTLTPGHACPKYGTDLEYGHGYGAKNLEVFRSTYLPAIGKRLQTDNPGIVFNDAEIYSMQEMCGFEILSKGSSYWCKVFTRDEWLSFEYARDLLYYYRSGPGNRYGPSLGWLWLNATADLLRQGPEAGPLFFSFNHDGDITAMLGALDLFPQKPHLPNSHELKDRAWRMSDVTPMGGRLIFERLSCPAEVACWNNAQYGYPNHIYCEPPTNDTYIRINVNDGIVPIPDCQNGPGNSCPLEGFLERVEKRGEEIEPFHEICEVEEGMPRGITFLHQ